MKRVAGRWFVERETERAVLVRPKGRDEARGVWIPKRSVDLDDLRENGELWVDDWVVRKKGLKVVTAER